MAVRVQLKFYKTVSHWNSEQGQGVTVDGKYESGHWCTDCGLDASITVDDHTGVEQAVKDYLDNNYMPSDYLAIMDDGRLSFNTIENGNGDIITSAEEQENLEKNGKQLYICDYDIMVDILAQPTADQLSILFPSAEKMF